MMLPHLNVPLECQRLCLGVSGGVDSVVLLHWAAQNKMLLDARGVALLAIHVNHQLSDNSDHWEQQVVRLCLSLGIPLAVQRVEVDVVGDGLEQAARKARYAAFECVLEVGDILALGHHQDDQAETFLLRLMRGAGVQGLASMPSRRQLGCANIWRPFLATPKSSILNYAKENRLDWVEDESNSDTRFDRNYLRQVLLPKLYSRWPQAARKISQAAHHAAEAQALMDEYAVDDLNGLDLKVEKYGCSLCIAKLKWLSLPRQKQALRYWIRSLGYLAPEAKHLVEIGNVMEARGDSVPALWLSDCGFSRFANRLYLLPGELKPNKAQVSLGEGVNTLPDGSCLRLSGVTEPLVAKFRVGGERSRPRGRSHSQVLKKLLPEYGVPPWLRYQVPLIYAGNDLVAVGDYWLEDREGLPLEVFWDYPI